MRTLATFALLLPLALATGCGGDEPGAGPTPSSTTSTASASPGDTPDPSPSDVASGLRVSMPNSSLRAPEGWVRGADLTRYEDEAESPDHLSYVTLGETPAFGSTADAKTLGDHRMTSNVYPRKPRRLPETTLDGVQVYHVAGQLTHDQYIEEYGAIVDDSIVTVTFSFNRTVSESARDQVMAEVLPTFHWK